MKDYSKFSVNDFVLDDFFRAWVKAPDEHSSTFWMQWLKDHPERAKDVEEATNIVKHVGFQQYAMSGDDIANLWNRIKTYESKPQGTTAPARVWSTWYKVAASFLLLASSFLVYRLWNDTHYLDYHTAYGETKTIVLPDSSTVILNSNSTLRFPSHWEEQPVRELWLQGEAYFSVIHKRDHQPFKVYTGEGVAVEVLGTTFNVYHRTEETKIVLNTGKIRLHLPAESAAQDIIMKPGDLVEYKQKSYSRRMVNPATYTAWTEKKLVLDHTSLRDMVDMLRDNYGVEVAVEADSLLNQTVSGSMPITDVESLVSQIAQTFQLKITKQKNRYLMYE
ncbi:FecR domain-containing protein [Fulvivirgaceae bacterium PWU4]|uniref:FecR domain-containing protein n=1 Tax=Chryseosolibacter histidini TaxID=2782349 RepID=A0AAP2DLE8_9BACT|nr:FecR domain-containing protein [Chryseosolibacter histidini]MBT1698521.1 FecR domain-containing protein [Chryseosolibacter histidini]